MTFYTGGNFESTTFTVEIKSTNGDGKIELGTFTCMGESISSKDFSKGFTLQVKKRKGKVAIGSIRFKNTFT